MKALVLWSDPASPNLGVRALAAGTAEVLDRAFPGVEVSCQSYGPGDSPVRIGDWHTLARLLTRPRGELIDWLKTFDLVVDTRAGDSFADIYGLSRLTTMTLMAELVTRANVPLVYGPQTFGPFKTKRGLVLAWRSLRRARSVIARDPVSAEQVFKIARRHPTGATDVVFALRAPIVRCSRDVIFNVSGLLWNPNDHVDFRRYREIVIGLYSKLTGAGRSVTLLAHVLDSPDRDNDVPAIRQLSTDLGGVDVMVPKSLNDARARIAEGCTLIGSRMHSCLNALSVGVPAIPLAYSHKFAPLLSDIGWPVTFDLNDAQLTIDQLYRAVQDPPAASAVAAVRARVEELSLRSVNAVQQAVA